MDRYYLFLREDLRAEARFTIVSPAPVYMPELVDIDAQVSDILKLKETEYTVSGLRCFHLDDVCGLKPGFLFSLCYSPA